MSQNLRNYLVAVFALDAAITAAPADSWSNQSPCEEWTARDVAGHAMGVVSNVAARLGKAETVDPFVEPGKIAGDDVVASWTKIRNNVLEALDQPGALDHPIEHPQLGNTNIDGFIAMMTGDALIHSWDIARATGGNERLDPGLIPVVLEGLQKRDPKVMRSPGRYKAETTIASDVDPQTRLLAYVGRKV
jgi:uncharacterized protein (TIGR03086 family)